MRWLIVVVAVALGFGAIAGACMLLARLRLSDSTTQLIMGGFFTLALLGAGMKQKRRPPPLPADAMPPSRLDSVGGATPAALPSSPDVED
jgi:hypothetical protein